MWCIRLLNAIGRDTLEYSHLIGIAFNSYTMNNNPFKNNPVINYDANYPINIFSCA